MNTLCKSILVLTSIFGITGNALAGGITEDDRYIYTKMTLNEMATTAKGPL